LNVLADDFMITQLGMRKAQVRRVKDLNGVTLSPVEGEEVVYKVFRDVEPVHQYDLRADVTVLYPGALPDGEFYRTHGHFHPEGPWGKPWPEVYCVLRGRGKFLLHDLERVYVVELKEGDVVKVPEGMAHVLVNDSDEPLLTCNYVSKSVTPDYGRVKALGGPAAFLTKDGIVLNRNYDVKEIKVCKPLPLNLDSLVATHAVKPSVEEWLTCFPYKG